MILFWRRKRQKNSTDGRDGPPSQIPAPIPPAGDNPYLNPASASEYEDPRVFTYEDDESDEDEDNGSGESGGGSGGGPRARRNDGETDNVRGQAGRGSMAVGGATSKGDGDARMTAKQRNAIIRNASVQVRAMADSGDAMDKARSGQFNTLDSEVKAMSGQDLYGYMSSNPAQMGKTGDHFIQHKMIQDGFQKQLDVLTQGTYEAAQNAGRKEVMGALMAKPLSEMDPAQQAFVWDKLAELGEVSGRYEGNMAALEQAVGGFVMRTASGEQMAKEGLVSLNQGIKGPQVDLKTEFMMAVHNVAAKAQAAYHQVLKFAVRPGRGM